MSFNLSQMHSDLTQIIKETTRYNPKSITMGTLLDIILTNLPSKYISAVFNQGLSDHCLIACVRTGSAVKLPPLITVKRSLKHFCEQAFLIDLARVSWKDINICHLADAFIQSDLQSCVHTFYVWVVPGIEPRIEPRVVGIEPTTLALQVPCSTN